MTFNELIATLICAREDFKNAVDNAHEKKQQHIKELKETMIPNTKAYEEKKKAILAEYDAEVGAAMSLQAEYITPAIANLREATLKRAQYIDEPLMAKLNALYNIPLSADELKTLANRYCTETNGSYWAGRIIETLAEKNAVDISELDIEPGIATKIAVLDDLAAQFEKFTMNYNPEKPYDPETAVCLSSAVLERAETRYTGKEQNRNETQVVEKMYNSIVSATSSLEKAMLLNNCLKNAKGEVRNLFLARITGKDFGEMVYKLCDYKEEIDDFKSGKAHEYMKARAFVDDVKKMNSSDAIRQRILEREENSFVMPLLKKAAKDNRFISNALNPIPEENTAGNDGTAKE